MFGLTKGAMLRSISEISFHALPPFILSPKPGGHVIADDMVLTISFETRRFRRELNPPSRLQIDNRRTPARPGQPLCGADMCRRGVPSLSGCTPPGAQRQSMEDNPRHPARAETVYLTGM